MNRLFSKIILCFFLCLGLWLAGLLWFIGQIPEAPLSAGTKADAIVVLTGGGGRLEYGLQLLAEGRGKKLFISGVHQTGMEGILRHAGPDVRAKLAAAPSAIILGHQAENTIGNAEETSDWLKKEGFTSILLVTASYHMPRSLLEFEEAADNVAIIPAPVFPDNFILSGWWGDSDSRARLLVEYHKFLAAEARHRLVPIMRRP